MAESTKVERARLELAKRAVALTFAANGFAFGSFASRIPAIKSGLSLDSAHLGFLLLCVSIGSLTSLPLSGAIVHRLGAARSVLTGSGAEVTGLLLASLGLAMSNAWVTGASLIVTGFGIGLWDVSMNVEGAKVERALGRSVMARFHAAWSFGSVGGALLGAVGAAVGLPVAAQLAGTAVVIGIAAIAGALRYTPMSPAHESTHDRSSRSLAWEAWKTPRVLLIGVMTLAFALTEGVANDWVALSIVDGYDQADALGAVGFGAFVSAMTLARLTGGKALDRWGRVPVLRVSVGVALAGLLLVVIGPLALALLGAALWGTGAALGFPTGMSAAADDPRRAALNVSVVSSIGYTAFLAGPPIVGWLADAFEIRRALLVVAVALAVAFVTIPAAREQSVDG